MAQETGGNHKRSVCAARWALEPNDGSRPPCTAARMPPPFARQSLTGRRRKRAPRAPGRRGSWQAAAGRIAGGLETALDSNKNEAWRSDLGLAENFASRQAYFSL